VNRRVKERESQRHKPWRDPFRLRLNFILFCLVCVAGAVMVRSFVFAALKSEPLAALARQEHHQTVTVAPSRGLIFDRHQVELAVSVQVHSIYARPGRIEDRGEAAKELAKALRMDRREIMELLSKPHPFVWLKRQVEPEIAATVVDLDLAGVGVVPEPKRFYPHRDLAAHLLGFAGVDSKGLEGLEKAYDQQLQGQSGKFSRKRDARGRIIHVENQFSEDQTRGQDLVLTIDKRIQHFTQRSLAQAVAANQARAGLALVMAPRTGEILAMAVHPDFNPNVYAASPSGVWRNRALTDPFEPGSTFKIFTLAAALEERTVTTETKFDCENGQFRVGAHVIHDTHPHKILRLPEVFAYSSNIGAAKIGLALGPQRFHRHLGRFGFGQLSGIDLPGESAGLLNPAERWQPIDTANIAFGQGVAVTAMQLAAGVGAVANRGVLMKPFVVREILGPDGRTVERRQPQPRGRAMSAATASTMLKLMEGVVDDRGTGTKARVAGYTVAGKTGTAQKLDPATGTYSNKRHQAIFVGLAPAENPELVVLVVIDEPKTSPYGGVVAAPVFATVVGEALPLLGVGPTQPEVIKAQANLGQDLPDPPRPLLTPAEPQEINLALRQEEMPRLTGLPLRQALEVVGQMGLAPQVEGSGVVVSQSPAPGQRLKGVKSIKLRLKPEWT
jgi:cell division protein FtsI (penicillin-binding protein 3)